MAQFNPKLETLSFYPPRSRWYTRIVYALARPFRHYCNLDALREAAPVSLGGLLLAFALPGFTFFALDRRLYGWLCLGGYVVAFGLFLVALGYWAGSFGYGLMISLHASSLIYLHYRWQPSNSFARRLAFGFATLFVVWALLYAPLAGYAQRNWFTPMRTENKVWVIKPNVDTRSLRRGDYVLHQIKGQGGPGVYLREGWGIDPVLGLPGDHLRFTRAAILVNGKPFPRAAMMPEKAELEVPENVWFIWTELGITRRGAAPVGGIMPVMQEIALVRPEQIIGKPYKYWFGRRQWP